MNNSQEIILAQISAIYDKPPFVKVKTGQSWRMVNSRIRVFSWCGAFCWFYFRFTVYCLYCTASGQILQSGCGGVHCSIAFFSFAQLMARTGQKRRGMHIKTTWLNAVYNISLNRCLAKYREQMPEIRTPSRPRLSASRLVRRCRSWLSFTKVPAIL